MPRGNPIERKWTRKAIDKNRKTNKENPQNKILNQK